MTLWQVDFSARPLTNPQGQTLWELLIVDPSGQILHQAQCSQTQARFDWLIRQLEICIQKTGSCPERIQLFRPQSLSVFELAANELNLMVEPTRHTPALKRLLAVQAERYPTAANYTGEPYQPLHITSLPPVPVPDHLWGDGWQFTGLMAGELETHLITQPIPILSLRMDMLPSQLGLETSLFIPGVIIYGGHRSMTLARWCQEQNPAEVEFIPGQPNGLIMSAGLRERWVLATFEDPQVRQSAQGFMTRRAAAKGLHFLLIQPDESGVTYTGLWLLQQSSS